MANGYFGNIPQKDDLRPFGCYRADLEGPLLSFAFPGARVSDPAGVMPPAKSLILAQISVLTFHTAENAPSRSARQAVSC